MQPEGTLFDISGFRVRNGEAVSIADFVRTGCSSFAAWRACSMREAVLGWPLGFMWFQVDIGWLAVVGGVEIG